MELADLVHALSWSVDSAARARERHGLAVAVDDAVALYRERTVCFHSGRRGRRVSRETALVVAHCILSNAPCLRRQTAPKSLRADKGKPTERWGRKASGLRTQVYDSGVASDDERCNCQCPDGAD